MAAMSIFRQSYIKVFYQYIFLMPFLLSMFSKSCKKKREEKVKMNSVKIFYGDNIHEMLFELEPRL